MDARRGMGPERCAYEVKPRDRPADRPTSRHYIVAGGVVLVATFAADTPFAGRVITFFEPDGRLALEGFGPVSAQTVVGFDDDGALVWARAELQPWVRRCADQERLRTAAAPAALDLPARGAACEGAPPQGRWSTGRVALLACIGLVAAIAGLAVALDRHDSGAADSSQAHSGMRAVTDPGPPLSVGIGKQANAVYRAHVHVLKACLAARSGDTATCDRQQRAAQADLQTALSLRPADDGTRQWALADRYDRSVVGLWALVEGTTARLRGRVSEWGEVPGFDVAQKRASRACDGYYEYMHQENWAGYVVHGQRFTSVTATWIQPETYAAGGQERRMVVWVGLDGSGRSSRTVEQIGTATAQSAAVPQAKHWAWYEIYPAPPVSVPPPRNAATRGGLAVAPGDIFTATVTSLGGHRFRLDLVNRTRGQSFTIVQSNARATCRSAEIIVEMPPPSSGWGFSDFAPVRFTDCAIDGRPLSSYDIRPINIHDYGNRFMTRTSGVDRDGSGFTVTRR